MDFRSQVTMSVTNVKQVFVALVTAALTTAAAAKSVMTGGTGGTKVVKTTAVKTVVAINNHFVS